MNPAAVHAYLIELQNRLVAELERVEGRPFRRDHWQRNEGGGGESRIIEDGDVFERGGVNFSRVQGERLPPSASAARADLVVRRRNGHDSLLRVRGGRAPLSRHVPAGARGFRARVLSPFQTLV